MSDLNIQQRLALWKFLAEGLARQRTAEMIPASRKEMPSGSRIAAMFGGQPAAWIVMPQAKQKAAFVADPAKVLAWAKRNHPAKVSPVTRVVESPELIAHLREHFPAALADSEQVDPQWVADLCAAMKEPGYYVTAEGEKLTEVPGITLPEKDPPVPTVTLTDDAEQVIGAAWRAGDIPAGELLALPAGDGS